MVSLEMHSRVAVLCCVAGAVVQAVLVRLRPKTAMQAGCHLLVCETFCWSGLNSFPTKRMKRQRSSSSLAGLGRDLALNGSFGRVRDECRSPEWRAERAAVFGLFLSSLFLDPERPDCRETPRSAWRGVSTVRAASSRSCHSPQQVRSGSTNGTCGPPATSSGRSSLSQVVGKMRGR